MENIPINSLCLGKGRGEPPILLLHGWGHHLGVLQPLGELLAEFREVHLLDLPGHGKSGTPEEVWCMEDFAERVIQYLRKNEIEQVDLIGHSFGGKTGIKLASKNPELVRKLVLINSSGLKPIRTLKKRIRFKAIAWLRTVVKLLDKFLS